MTRALRENPVAETPLSRLSIGRHIINHLGVVVASKFVPLASIFVYSRFMSVADYGLLNLFQSYLWIFILALSFNLHVAIGRYIYTPGAATESFLGTTVQAVGGIFVVGAALLSIWAEEVGRLLGLPSIVLPFMLAIVFGQLVESLFTQIVIHDQRSGLLLKVVASKALVTFLGSVALLWAMPEDKFMAVLVAEAATSVGLSLFVTVLLRQRVVWSFRTEHLFYIVRYSLPLIPYMLGLTLMSQFDRILIDHFFGKEATGLYSLGYNFGMLLVMVVTAVLNAFNPSFFEALNRGDVGRVKRDADALFALAMIATVSLILFAPEVADWLLPAKYAESFHLIPLIALAGLCFVVFQTWVRVLAFAHKTSLIALIAVAGAVLNIALNLWLLPLFGYVIAAFTTTIGYLAMSVLCVVAVNLSTKDIRVSLQRELACIAAVALLLLALQQHAIPFSVFGKAVVLGATLWSFRRALLPFLAKVRA